MSVFVHDPDFELHVGDALETLTTLPDGSVDCVVTSPPYWGLRDYGTGVWEGGDPDCDHLGEPKRTQAGFNERYFGRESVENKQAELRVPFKDECGKCGATRTDSQLGLEATPDEYVARMVGVFREVRRVLADHGSLWLNLGDSYAQKGLVGVPWRVAFALQADGWYLRSDIIWSKPNPMPESVTDRPTKSHEYVFLLTKGPRYFFDQEAVRERFTDPREGGEGFRWNSNRYTNQTPGQSNHTTTEVAKGDAVNGANPAGRNIRSVWEIATRPFPEAHFATYPPELVRRCLLAGCPERVCQSCGKPSERIVERPDRLEVGRGSGRLVPSENGRSSRKVGQAYQDWMDENPAQTIGWSDCGHNDWRPGTVLDPFIGSGTTALVAREHGRRCVGIELNPDYAQMAARRLGQLSLLA